jgi:hypothetical protein
MRGLQIGLGNMAGSIDGTQIGFYNVSSHSTGLQLGVINYAGTHDGIPFGVVNLSPKSGTAEAVVYGSTLSAANAGVRTTVNGWQSTIRRRLRRPRGRRLDRGLRDLGLRLPHRRRLDLVARLRRRLVARHAREERRPARERPPASRALGSPAARGAAVGRDLAVRGAGARP